MISEKIENVSLRIFDWCIMQKGFLWSSCYGV